MNPWLAGVLFGGIGLVVGACWADEKAEDDRSALRDDYEEKLAAAQMGVLELADDIRTRVYSELSATDKLKEKVEIMLNASNGLAVVERELDEKIANLSAELDATISAMADSVNMENTREYLKVARRLGAVKKAKAQIEELDEELLYRLKHTEGLRWHCFSSTR